MGVKRLKEKKENQNKSVMEHRYFLPKNAGSSTENLRSVSVVRLNESVTISSSYPDENLIFLANLALDLISKIRENKN